MVDPLDRPTSLPEAGPSAPPPVSVPAVNEATILSRWEKQQPQWIADLQWCETREDCEEIQLTIDALPTEERVLAQRLFTWIQTMALVLEEQDVDLGLITNCPIALPCMQKWIDRKRNAIRLRRGEVFVDALPAGITHVTTVEEQEVLPSDDVAGETLARNLLESRIPGKKRKQTG